MNEGIKTLKGHNMNSFDMFTNAICESMVISKIPIIETPPPIPFDFSLDDEWKEGAELVSNDEQITWSDDEWFDTDTGDEWSEFYDVYKDDRRVLKNCVFTDAQVKEAALHGYITTWKYTKLTNQCSDIDLL